MVTSVNPLDGRAEVELAHETLITAWGRLQGWIEEDRAGLVVRQRLAEDAMWERSGRKGDYLYRRAQLEPAQQWNATHPDDLTPLEAAFVAASQRQQRVGMVRRFAVVAALIAVPVVTALVLMAMFRNGPFSLPQITWTRFEEPTALKTAVIDVAFGIDGTVYAGLTSEISRSLAVSDDGGATWSIHDTPTNELSVLAASPTRPGLLYGVTGDARPCALRTMASLGNNWTFLHLPRVSMYTMWQWPQTRQSTRWLVIAIFMQATIVAAPGWRLRTIRMSELEHSLGRRAAFGWKNGRTMGVASRAWLDGTVDRQSPRCSEWCSSGGYVVHRSGQWPVALPEDGAPCRMSDDRILQIAVVPLDEPILIGRTDDSVYCWRPDAPAPSLIAEKSRFSPSTELRSLRIASGNPKRFWIVTDAGLYVGDAEEWLARGGCRG